MLRQNWIASSLNAWLRPRLPLGWLCQLIVGSSQTSSGPRDFNASLFVFQLLMRYFCGAGFILFRLPDLRILRGLSLIYATKPFDTLCRMSCSAAAHMRIPARVNPLNIIVASEFLNLLINEQQNKVQLKTFVKIATGGGAKRNIN